MDRKLKATTLIEMIIVMTIFSVIGAAIATSFMAGMRIWGRVNNRDFKHNFILLEIESIARRIRQSIGIKEVEHSDNGRAPVVCRASMTGGNFFFNALFFVYSIFLIDKPYKIKNTI